MEFLEIIKNSLVWDRLHPKVMMILSRCHLSNRKTAMPFSIYYSLFLTKYISRSLLCSSKKADSTLCLFTSMCSFSKISCCIHKGKVYLLIHMITLTLQGNSPQKRYRFLLFVYFSEIDVLFVSFQNFLVLKSFFKTRFFTF